MLKRLVRGIDDVYKSSMSLRMESLFATQVGRGSLKGSVALNRDLLLDIGVVSKTDKVGREWSKKNYLGGYTSYASLCDMHHRTRAFLRFHELMQSHANAFASAQAWNLRGLKLVMTDCWVNVMALKTSHSSHLHPHSVISGTYFVKTPPGSVCLKLEDPRMGFYMNAPLRCVGKNVIEGLGHEIQAKAGTFVLFESWLRHEVPPNRSSASRVSLSFNYSLEEEDLL